MCIWRTLESQWISDRSGDKEADCYISDTSAVLRERFGLSWTIHLSWNFLTQPGVRSICLKRGSEVGDARTSFSDLICVQHQKRHLTAVPRPPSLPSTLVPLTSFSPALPTKCIFNSRHSLYSHPSIYPPRSLSFLPALPRWWSGLRCWCCSSCLNRLTISVGGQTCQKAPVDIECALETNPLGGYWSL